MTTLATTRALTLIALIGLSACATLPADRGRADVSELLSARGHTDLAAQPPDDSAAVIAQRLRQPLTAEDAVEIAWLSSPRVRAPLAELGLAAADLFESGRLRNPRLSAARLGDDQSVLGLSVIVSDLITLPARSRIGRQRWQAAQARATQALIEEAAATRADYYRYVAAMQIAALRAAVSEAASVAAELAQRFHAAGNISALQLAREQAAAAVARNNAAHAEAERFAARMHLAERLGLAGKTNAWRTVDRLFLPPASDPGIDALLVQAGEQRLDLIAAQSEFTSAAANAQFARRYGWLGEIELGYEREREAGTREQGPTLALELPLFQQGQAGRARAGAEHELARGRLAQAQLDLEREVRTGWNRLVTQRQIVTTYRDALIPQRQAIVAREQERYNFMLIGAFDLIQARQQEFDAYQAYLEAIRDYWLARTELAHAVGGRLPDDAAALEPAPAIDDIVAPGNTTDRHPHHHEADQP